MLSIPWQTWNEFEIVIMDLAETCGIKTKNEMEWFSDMLHQEIETALTEYAEDAGVSDYEPSY